MRERVNREVWAALTTACHSAGIPDRAAFALWDAYNGRDVTRPYYLYLADISDSAATQDLASMRAAGLLAPVGRTRGRHYVAGPRLFRAIAAELGLRGDEVDHDQIVRYVTSYVSEHPVEIEAPTTTEALLPELVATPTTSVVQWPRGSTRTGEPQH
ncbi:MAG: hypothetical protein AUH85_09750 [Chloroflexi bacterium 13_1_40CM_4_68_4]|nr:MAG: hypothetical protein AUH85_09750 [Chloroflexi bacterium 13_1_40CM_4_68_4]